MLLCLFLWEHGQTYIELYAWLRLNFPKTMTLQVCTSGVRLETQVSSTHTNPHHSNISMMVYLWSSSSDISIAFLFVSLGGLSGTKGGGNCVLTELDPGQVNMTIARV